MAKSIPGGRKPRVRASAPTLRERQEAARAKEEAKSNAPVKKRRLALAKVTSPFKKLRLRDRAFVKVLGRIFRPVGRILRFIAPTYLIEAWRELRKVIWPSRRETWRLTLAVFVFAIIFGAMVAGVDKGLDELFKKVVLK